MNRWFALVALVVFGLALVVGAACGGGDEGDGGDGGDGVTQLKLGIGIPLTGGYGSAVGLPAKHAFEDAVDEVGVFEVGGKQYKWKIIFEDNLATVAGGNASTLKFVHDHHVDFMHQATADPGLSAVAITEQYDMLLDTAGLNYDDFSSNKPHFFQSAATWSLHAPAFFHWLREAHPEVQKVALVAPDDRTGHAVGDAVVDSAEHFGFDIVVEQYTAAETVEYSHIATAIYPKDPDIIVSTSTDIYVLLKERGWDGLGASYYWTNSGPEKNGWENVEGMITFLPNPTGTHWPEVIAFREAYEHDHGLELTPAAFWAADVIFLLTGALQKAGTVDDMDAIAATMETEKFDTLIGPLGYGLEALNGIGHVAIYPTPIMQVTGREEYELMHMYTAEETEALMLEVYGE